MARNVMKDKIALKRPADENERDRALNDALKEIEKVYGKGSIMRMGSVPREEIEAIPTGALNLDLALGIGGVPRGRVVEIFGPESSGKTTLALEIVAQAQKMGGMGAFIDAEHALDIGYAKALGVDVDNLILSQPDDGEQALEIVDHLVRSSALDVIVIDSVAALVPRAEIRGEMGDTHVGLLARLMSQALRKLTPNVARSNTCVIFLNQVRHKIGGFSPYGPEEVTTGGLSLKFYSSVRLRIRRGEQIRDKDHVYGSIAKVKVVKNKVAPPFKQVEFDIMYGTGISKTGAILATAVQLEVIEKAGSWFYYKGDKLAQGKENVKKLLEEQPELTKEIEEAVRAKIADPNSEDAFFSDSDSDDEESGAQDDFDELQEDDKDE